MTIEPIYGIGKKVEIFSHPEQEALIIDCLYSFLTNRITYQVLLPAYGDFPASEKYCIEEEIIGLIESTKKQKAGFKS